MGVGCGIPWELERIGVPTLRNKCTGRAAGGPNRATLAPRQRVYRTEVVEFTHNERGTSLSLHRKSAYIGRMKISDTPKGPARIASRGMAALLVVLISASPVYGQGTGDPAAPSTKSSGSSYEEGHFLQNASAQSSTASHAAATRRNARRRGTKAQRMARTARIKQAFVASTELRPMAQQLTTLRTPAAYEGVTALCAPAHRGCGGGRLPVARTRLPARQALCRRGLQFAPGAPEQ